MSRYDFKCPDCDTENRNPKQGKTDSGTPVVDCSGCHIRVSMSMLDQLRWEQGEVRRKAINKFLGWGVDVYFD